MYMPEDDLLTYRRRRLPLAFRLSLILILVTVLPLLLIVGISEYTARPVLINQANQTMEADAQARIQLINAYFQERLLDLEAFSQAPGVQNWLFESPELRAIDQAGPGALGVGITRDKHYMTWSLFDANDQLLLSAPALPPAPQEIATLPAWFQAIQTSKTGKVMISPVYYDATLKKAFVDMYAPIYQDGQPNETLLGFARVKLNLDYIWGIVQNDKGIANSGNSFILDTNGVRIADSGNHNLFTTVAPLSSQLQQQIATENWYGTHSGPKVQADTALASIVKHPNQPKHFTLTPYGQTQNYQAAFTRATFVPWTYVVTSPSSVVTQTADQQLLTTTAGALVLLALAALIGLLLSNRISQPIMYAVAQLRENSETLNDQAQKQQSASNEQSWVIESIQVGLQSVQYYTDATRISAHKLGEIGDELQQGWHRQNTEMIRQGLQEVIDVAQYIEKAADYQTESSQKLNIAIKVTSQVNDQLAEGSTSATKTAGQLTQVVNNLRNVVGQ
jgi:hypothetical protein